MRVTSTTQQTTTDDRAGRAPEPPRPVREPARHPRIHGLDGLRAIAVLAVIAYHLWPDALPGGYLGVDVFFVVSGFLITTLLLREMTTTGRLDMPAFWVRRARRLVPALLVVVVVSIVAARLTEPDLLVGIGRQVVGAVTFSTNWLEIAAGSSYFDATAPELFQPFWSLAIEEQFYVLWPLLLAGLLLGAAALHARAGARLVAVVVGAAAVVSAVLMAVLHTPGADPTRVYYGTFTHAFGLLAGAAFAIAWAGGARPLERGGAHADTPSSAGRPAAGAPTSAATRAVQWVPVGGLAVLAVLMGTLRAEGTFAYRGGIALASVAALAAVIGCASRQPRGLMRVLDLPAVVWVGERSYGLYLWHWPVILVVAAVFGDAPGSPLWWRAPLVALLVTFAFAALSHRFVETPIRRDGFRAVARRVRDAVARVPGARVAAGATALLVLTAAACVATAPDQTSTQRAVEAAQREIEERGSAPSPTHGTEPTAPTTSKPSAGASAPPSGAPAAPLDGSDVIGFGDSVLSAAAPTLFDELSQIAIDAKPIRKWLDAPALVARAEKEGRLRPVVLLHFGTNGGFQFEGSEKAFTTTLDRIGPDRQVVLYTVVGYSYWVDDANARMRELVADRPNVHVVDWNAYVAEHPGLLHADKTHPNMKGVVAYADLLRATLKDLHGA